MAHTEVSKRPAAFEFYYESAFVYVRSSGWQPNFNFFFHIYAWKSIWIASVDHSVGQR